MTPVPDKWTVIKTYTSKKNTVRKVECDGKYYVVKKYHDDFITGLQVEEKVLEECGKNQVGVPEIIEKLEDSLILEDISGTNCKELFDSQETGAVLSGIAEWLCDFHSSFGHKKRRGDCILANFILSDTEIYGIDFEESQEGNYLRDIGDMCTSILRMRPAFTFKRFRQIDYFLDEYFACSSKPRIDITDYLVESLLHYSNYGSQKEELKRWAVRLKEVGLDNIIQSLRSE